MWVVVALVAAGWLAAGALLALAVGRSIGLADRHRADEQLWREIQAGHRDIRREARITRWRGRQG